MRSVLAVVTVACVVFSIGGASSHAQNGRTSGPIIEWPTYGGNLASHRYSPADQITKDNFNQLQIAWRLKTDFLGPRPDTLYSATPLLVDRVLYTTAGMRRAAIALNAATGEMLWMHTEDEGVRGAERAAQRRRPRPRLLGRRERRRSAHHLRHARLSDDGARREDRQSRFPPSDETASSI